MKKKIAFVTNLHILSEGDFELSYGDTWKFDTTYSQNMGMLFPGGLDFLQSKSRRARHVHHPVMNSVTAFPCLADFPSETSYLLLHHPSTRIKDQ